MSAEQPLRVVSRTGARVAVLRGLLFGAGLLLAALPVSAHRGHGVWTDIVWNGSGFEITHRLHLADAVNIQRSLGGRGDIDTPRGLALLALYVEERFLLLVDSRTITPQTLGAEIDDDFLFVYQEWMTELPQHFPRVANRLLIDVEPGAQQFIRISGPGVDEERRYIDTDEPQARRSLPLQIPIA
jgi:hypothetical protein